MKPEHLAGIFCLISACSLLWSFGLLNPDAIKYPKIDSPIWDLLVRGSTLLLAAFMASRCADFLSGGSAIDGRGVGLLGMLTIFFAILALNLYRQHHPLWLMALLTFWRTRETPCDPIPAPLEQLIRQSPELREALKPVPGYQFPPEGEQSGCRAVNGAGK